MFFLDKLGISGQLPALVLPSVLVAGIVLSGFLIGLLLRLDSASCLGASDWLIDFGVDLEGDVVGEL